MKPNFFTLLAIAAIAFLAQSVHAKVRRVGYPGKAVAGTDYPNLQMAVDSSNAKDSIYIFPGNWGANVSKRLVFEGYGSPQGDTALQVGLAASGTYISLFPGSDSSIIEGIDGLILGAQPSFYSATIAGTNMSGGVVNNIIIRRCHTQLIEFNDQTLSGWVISQCVIDVNNSGSNFSGKNLGGIEGGGGSLTNLLVTNSIIYGIKLDNGFCAPYNTSEQSATGFFVNNILFGNQSGLCADGQGWDMFNGAAFNMQNNIFVDVPSLQGIGAMTWQNNISTQADIPLTNPNGSATNNKQNVANSTIFVGYPTQGNYANDARYTLATGSPAKGAGIGGIDCGIFVGSTPFKLDCVPALPAFFKLSAPSSNATANPYTITFSVRSNN